MKLKKQTIENVKEFAIENKWKYIRELVKIDKSSNNPSKLSEEINPVFVEEALFLKVIIEGAASLYSFESETLARYFFKTGNTELAQLIYKSYKTESQHIAKNQAFKQQLYNALQCHSIEKSDFGKIGDNEKELTQLFTKFNLCTASDFKTYSSDEKRELFNLNFKAGLSLNKMSLTNDDIFEVDFDQVASPQFGIETEFILPTNKNKWAIIVSPTYQTYETEESINADNVSGGVINTTINYSLLNFR